MSDRLPAGPYRTLSFDGGDLPYYIIPFDKRGACQAPQTRAHLLSELADGDYTDVFLFSHGWNNDWTVATERYEDFLEGYMKMRRDRNLPMPDGYKPLLVGIFWPSTLLVFTAKEKGPEMASGQPAAVDEAVAEERREVAELAEALDAEGAEELYRLSQKEELDESEARRLAEVLLPIFQGEDGELGEDEDFNADDLLEAWSSAPQEDDLDDFIAGGGGAQAAGFGDFVKKFDPRKIVRTATVYQMKDRAGRVGAHGVSPLLRDILADCGARVHLIGHSYGGKIVLSATAAGGDLPRPVRSMLLLQPAVSHLSFADRVPKTDPPRPGGYRAVLSRVENPIFSTYSEHDFALTQLFHRAVRRKGDLGEAEIAAAAAGNPPSKYAALGGFGPRRAGEKLIEIHAPGEKYDLSEGAEIYGLDGSRDERIPGHGGISNPHTWWALYSLASL